MRNIRLRPKNEEHRAATRPWGLGLHFSTSKLLPRRRSRETLNVRIGKKLRPSASPDGRLQRSQIKSLKHFRAAFARACFYEKFLPVVGVRELAHAFDNYRETAFL